MTSIERSGVEQLGVFLVQRLSERALAAVGAVGENALTLAGAIGARVDVSPFLDRFDHMMEAGFPYDGPEDL